MPAAAVPTTVSAPASAEPVQTTAYLRAGTTVPVRTLEELTTKGKKLKAGQRFNIEVAEAVMLHGKVVIPAGSRGVGEVTSVRNKGMWGKSGNIDARILYVRVGEQQIRLTGTVNDKGVTGTAGVVGAIAFVPIAGFFTTGTSAVIPINTPVNAFTDEDIPVTFAGGVPATTLTASDAPAAPAAEATPSPQVPAPAPAEKAESKTN